MRLVDTVASVPHLLLGVVIVAVLGPSLTSVVISIGLTHWLSSARIVRSEILDPRTAARAHRPAVRLRVHPSM